MHTKLKEFDFAINVFKNVLKIDKKNFDAMLNLGLIRLQIDQKERTYDHKVSPHSAPTSQGSAYLSHG